MVNGNRPLTTLGELVTYDWEVTWRGARKHPCLVGGKALLFLSYFIFLFQFLRAMCVSECVRACVNRSRLHDVWARKQGSVQYPYLPTTEGAWGRPFPSLEVEVGMRDQVGLVGMTT